MKSKRQLLTWINFCQLLPKHQCQVTAKVVYLCNVLLLAVFPYWFKGNQTLVFVYVSSYRFERVEYKNKRLICEIVLWVIWFIMAFSQTTLKSGRATLKKIDPLKMTAFSAFALKMTLLNFKLQKFDSIRYACGNMKLFSVETKRRRDAAKKHSNRDKY